MRLRATSWLLLLHAAAGLRVHRESQISPGLAAPENARVDFPASRRMLRPGVLHFMFELKDQLQHPSIWGKFFSQALQGTYMAWAHCTDYHACENDYMMKLLGVRLVPKVYSARGADLVNPFAHMIRLALAETSNLAAAGVPEKFILLSDATLPVKPFSYIHWDQTSRTSSDICIAATNQWAKATIDGAPLALPKHHQWLSLSRRDAKALADDWTPVTNLQNWTVTLKQGRWANHSRSVPRWRFKNGAWFTATDEEAMYARAFGPVELRSEHDAATPMEMFNARRCITYVDWPHNVRPISLLEPHMTHSLENVTTSLLQTEVGVGLMQTYNVTTEVTLELLKDNKTRFTIGKGILHPFLIEQIGEVGLKVFRKSQYLFARKFSNCAQMPNFTDIMFSE